MREPSHRHPFHARSRHPLPLGIAAALSPWALTATAEAAQGSVPPAVAAAGESLRGLLPEVMFQVMFLDLYLWQWAALGVLIVGAWAAAWAATSLLHSLFLRLAARTATTLDDRLAALAFAPVRLGIFAALFGEGARHLSMGDSAVARAGTLRIALLIAAVSWLAIRLVDLATEIGREKLMATGRTAAVAALPLGARATKIFVTSIALIVLMQNMGVNVTGLLAGLGVGGLALALASQKSIANLFGGVSIIADQPVRVGDFCRFGDGRMGTVEDIGIRSTRVRTLDRTVITVPNAEFSEIEIENFGARDQIRLFTVLGLRYETTPDQMRHVLSELRKLLHSHPRVMEAPLRVRFSGFGAHSLDVELFAYVDTKDFNEFAAIREDILLRIMDVVAESGTGFAFPSQTLYLGRDAGMDATAARRAEERIAGWRGKGELPFPDFTAETRASLRGTLRYPPEGSVAAAAPRNEASDKPSMT